MEAVVVEKAEILIPNPKHKSFSGSNSFIPKDTVLKGEATLVKGRRKGSVFSYRLFKTDDNKYIFLDKINPTAMQKETKMNASGDMGRPLIVNTSAGKMFGKVPVAMAGVGALAGYAYCRYKKHDSAHKWTYIIGGAIVGYVAGRVLQSGNIISIKEGK